MRAQKITCPSADSRNAYVAQAANIRNTCYPEAVAGNTTGNFAANPLFVDAENGNFSLRHDGFDNFLCQGRLRRFLLGQRVGGEERKGHHKH